MKSKSKKLILTLSLVIFMVTFLCLLFIFEYSDLLNIKTVCQVKDNLDNLYQCLYQIINDKKNLQEQIQRQNNLRIEYRHEINI